LFAGRNVKEDFHITDPVISTEYLAVARDALPAHAFLLAVYGGGYSGVGCIERDLVRDEADCTLPSMGNSWV